MLSAVGKQKQAGGKENLKVRPWVRLSSEGRSEGGRR